jgi:hypothetical protein
LVRILFARGASSRALGGRAQGGGAGAPSLWLEREHRGRLGRAHRRRRPLCLERLEHAQRAHELGHCRAAVAQQGLERLGAIAVADQREREVAVVAAPVDEQLGLDAIGPGEPPGGGRDALREHGLERTDGRQLQGQRRLEGRELGAILVREHDVLLRPQPVRQGISRRACPAFGGFGPRDLAPFLRLASARALLTGTAARGAWSLASAALVRAWLLGSPARVGAVAARWSVMVDFLAEGPPPQAG